MNFLKNLWKNEPLRTTVYSTTGVVLAFLLATGKITASTHDELATLAGLILVGGGTEVARTQVVPVRKV